MQRVIGGLLYDTKESEVLYVEEGKNRVLYMTPNRNFFMVYPTGEFVVKTEESVKVYLGTYDVGKYIEVFGQPEEA